MIFITKPEDRSGSSINRLLLIMKLIALLVSINITMVMGDGLAQTITLQVKDISLVEAMRSIQKQSGHSYFLKGKELANIRVNADIKDLELSEAMSLLLQEKPADWVLEDGTIVIRPSIVEQVSIRPERKVKKTEVEEQERTITGKVTDAFDDTPISGVSVLVAGTSYGTTTDDDGIYELLANEGDSLIFTYVGYDSQKIEVTKVKIINVRLSEDSESLDEIVVVGFGQQKKESLVSSVASISGEELRAPVGKLSNAFAGQVPGLISVQRQW